MVRSRVARAASPDDASHRSENHEAAVLRSAKGGSAPLLPALIQRKELRLQRFIVADMFETMLKRKWGWWNWWVYDSAGKVMMSGREATRPMARYKAARALFQLLLTNSRLCDLRELKPKQIRPRTQSRQRR